MIFRILFSSLALIRGLPLADARLTAGRGDPGSILGSASGSGSQVKSDAGEKSENSARWVGDVDVGDAEKVENEKKRKKPRVAVDSFTVLEEVRHDKSSFTQGLSYGKDGTLFETTGLNGRSKAKVRRINPNTFKVELSINVDKNSYGEGSTVYTDAVGKERLIQLTWKKGIGFIYDAKTLEKLRKFKYETGRGNEGWGITYDQWNKEFIVSDGSEFLYFWDRDTLKEKRKVAVTRFNGKKQDQLNELEYMGGLVCMNILNSDDIICANTLTGKSVREYDMSSLWPKGRREKKGAGGLNGIAVGKDHVLLTGKNWDRMYKVTFSDWSTLF